MIVEHVVRPLNDLCDRLARPVLSWRGAGHPAYQVMGVVGLFAGYLLAGILTVRAGLPLWVMACLVFLACLLFLGQGMLYKMLLGYERLALLEQVPVLLAAAAAFVALLGRPVLAYLDIFTLGLATALVFGRVGCHMAGCCHGRPSRIGVCYRRRYVREGFPGYYVGLRLFPIQLLEAAVTLIILLAGLWLHLAVATSGVVLVWYVTSYAGARFAIEFARGDGARPYFLGLSLNQWICVFALWLLLLAGGWGLIDVTLLTAWTGVAVSGVLVICVIVSRRQQWPSLRHPRQVADVYGTLSRLHERAHAAAGEEVVTVRTAAGLLLGLSVENHPATGRIACHYSFSALEGSLNRERAIEMGRLLALHHRCAGPLTLRRSKRGCFHICLVQATAG